MDMLKHFGLKEDPFADPDLFESSDVRRVRAAIGRAVAGRGWVSVIGTPGSGKSFAVSEAMADLDCHVARSIASRSDYRVSCAEMAFFEDLFRDENPRKGKEARRRQLQRLLGEASREKPVLLVIDEATRCRGHYFTEIKFLRDTLRFGTSRKNPRRPDNRPLFAVLMIGWPSLADRLERSNELRPRIKRLRMNGLARAEIHDIIGHYGLAKICPKRTRDAIADVVRTPLQVVERLEEGMDRAYMRGSKTLSIEDVSLDVHDLFSIMKRYGLTETQVARGTGKSQAAIHNIVRGCYSQKTPRGKKTVAEVSDWIRAQAPRRKDEAPAQAG